VKAVDNGEDESEMSRRQMAIRLERRVVRLASLLTGATTREEGPARRNPESSTNVRKDYENPMGTKIARRVDVRNFTMTSFALRRSISALSRRGVATRELSALVSVDVEFPGYVQGVLVENRPSSRDFA
jgi:hypothetical protein